MRVSTLAGSQKSLDLNFGTIVCFGGVTNSGESSELLSLSGDRRRSGSGRDILTCLNGLGFENIGIGRSLFSAEGIILNSFVSKDSFCRTPTRSI